MVFRIFFVICAALAITLITALLGNWLKVKIENAEAESENLTMSVPEEEPEDDGGFDFTKISMSGVGINLGSFSENDALVLKLNSIDSASNTVFLTITDSAGNYYYSSPALSQTLRQPDYADSNGKFGLLTSASLAARAKNLTLCAIIEPTFGDVSPQDGAFVDSVIINELYSLGVTRVLVKIPNPTDEFSDEKDYYKAVHSYASALDINGCDVGFALSSSCISSSDGVKLVQNLEDCAAFYAVYFDFSDPSLVSAESDSVTHELNSLVGLFSVYNMHVLIEDNIYSSVVYKACVSAGVDNICFEGDIPADSSISTVVDGEGDEGDGGTESGDAKAASALDEEEGSKTSNPYASRADGTSDSETEAETETAEPDYDYNSGWDEPDDNYVSWDETDETYDAPDDNAETEGGHAMRWY